ncbi:ACP S-malonyltransferase [Streptomyces sp. NBC_00669]|uniref:ACP S-malonyltransferase n=1 Tax=unclassified Streptomyces TaxID=2593676 RepID=UPI002E20B910|nr:MULTISPECIES: ACP S-malonyltransferase [unclassified Streptomyces]
MLVNPCARDLLGRAEKVLDYDLLQRYRDADDDYSEYAQVAFLVNCLALAQWSERTMDAPPVACAGASFGGKAAAVHAGALAFEDAVWMTARMARCETEYFAEHHQDVVTHSFARTPWETLDPILRDLAEQGEWYDISCYIDADFYMVSLREEKVAWLEERLRAASGLPIYTMRPPMHCAVFAPLRDRVEEEVVGRLEFRDPELPFVADQDGSVLTTAAQVRATLLDGYVRPVRWPAVIEGLRGLGVGRLHVCGPDALFGRVGCTVAAFEVVNVLPRNVMRPRGGRPAA